MNRNNLLVVALLVLIVGAIYFFSLAVDTLLFPDTSPSVSYEMAPPQPDLEAAPPPEPPTPEEETARRALRDGRILPGTAADKLLNFLLSGKRNFSRELYELKYHQFDAEQAPTDSLNLELQQIAQILNAYRSLELDIASHTDGNGDKKEQREISEVRAKKIKAMLVGEGVAADRIKTIGYGASYPIADSNTPLSRQMNQRVEIVIRRL